MIQIGNHMRLCVPAAERDRAREFYSGVCGAKALPAPREDMELYEFSGGFVVGIWYVPEEKALSVEEAKKGAWLEIKTADPAALEARLREFGIQGMHHDPAGRFYFQAPGGQVFRIAPLEGGV